MPTEKDFIGDSCELGFSDETDKITLEMLQDDYRKTFDTKLSNIKEVEKNKI